MFSLGSISSFKDKENKNNIYRGKDWMKKFCESLIEHIMEIINFKKKKLKLLGKKQQGSYENGKICYICKEKINDKYAKDKEYCKVRDNCHYYTDECRSYLNIPQEEISLIFRINLNMYDYRFVIKELPKNFGGQFTC